MTEVITESISRISLSPSRQNVYCLIKHEDPELQPLVVSAFKARLPQDTYKIINSLDEYPGGPLLQFASKDSLDLEQAFHQPRMLISTYVTRDALIRKHLLGQTYATWVAKNGPCLLQTNVKTIANLELNPSESIYDVLDDTPLGKILEKNESKTNPADRVWWMLRPDLSDGSQDLRLFSTIDELQAAFDDFDAEYEREHAKNAAPAVEAAPAQEEATTSAPASDEKGTDDHHDASLARQSGGGWSSWFQITVTTEEHTDVVAPKRHVVAQRYVSRPLTFDGCKFQVSAYVVAVGALRVYVYKPLLALFAAKPFAAPWEHVGEHDLDAHSTYDGNVRLFWDLPDKPAGWKQSVFAQVCAITGEVFSAASAKEMGAHFQPLPQSFEVFAVNFAVDYSGKAMLADIRASPDMLHQTECGTKLSGLVQGLFEEVADVAVKPFFAEGLDVGAKVEESERLVKVVDLDCKKT